MEDQAGGFSLSRRAPPRKRKRRHDLPIPSFAGVGDVLAKHSKTTSLLDEISTDDDDSLMGCSGVLADEKDSTRPKETKRSGPFNVRHSSCNKRIDPVQEAKGSVSDISEPVVNDTSRKENTLLESENEAFRQTMANPLDAKTGCSEPDGPASRSSQGTGFLESDFRVSTSTEVESVQQDQGAQDTSCDGDQTEALPIEKKVPQEICHSVKEALQCTPSEETILAAVDEAYQQSDMTTTVKDIVKLLEKRFQISLKSQRHAIKARLLSLVQESQKKASKSDSSKKSNEVGGSPETSITPEPEPCISEETVINALDALFVTFEGRPIGIKTAMRNLEPQFGPSLSAFEGAIKKRLAELKKQRKAGFLSVAHETNPTEGNLSLPVSQEKWDSQKRPRLQSVATKTNLESHQDPSTSRSRQGKGSRACLLCLNCSCRAPYSEGGAADISNQSDFAVEKALMRRLVKLEQQTDQCADREGDCLRRLKKLRREMYKKRQILVSRGLGMQRPSSRYLPDVDEVEALGQRTGLRREKNDDVTKAKSTMFGGNVSTINRAQPTLTQLMGGKAETPPASPSSTADDGLETIQEENETTSKNHEYQARVSMAAEYG